VGPTARQFTKLLLSLLSHAGQLNVECKMHSEECLAERIDARLCKEDGLGIEKYSGRLDFALAFAMVHEVPNPAALFKDIYRALKPAGKLLFAEPAGHVQTEAFEGSPQQAKDVGFVIEKGPQLRRFHSAVLVRA
jgi:SAM-dependent methyltransferase